VYGEDKFNPEGQAMSRGNDLVEELLEELKARWNEAVTVKELAKLVRLDPSDVERLLRRRTGLTFKQYVNQRRKDLVIQLVMEGQSLGYQIALEIGFREEHSFYRWFKKAFGVTFREYCRQQRNLNSPDRAGSDLPGADNNPKEQQGR